MPPVITIKWTFNYVGKYTGEALSGFVYCDKGVKPDAKIQSLYGEKMRDGITDLKSEEVV